MSPRPLPRSLDPLPDEVLPGFLLRLSHRLEVPPGRIAALTGITTNFGRMLPLLQLRIPPRLGAAFARATRLSSAEVAALSLNSLRRRYPPLQLQYPTDGGNFVRRDKDLPPVRGWLLRHHSRFCPDCLAGDGSTIQDTHGGPWRRSWRLAVTFSCPPHRRLLQDRCPRCEVPALHRSRHTTDLLAAVGDILHPAQCRAASAAAPRVPSPSVCGFRLDSATPQPAEHGLEVVLAFQERLLARLRLDRPDGRDAGDSGYFYDLHLIMRLVRRSWPLAAQYAAPELDLGLIDEHVAGLDREMSRLRGAGKQVGDLRLRGGPADDPRTCGHLLALADQVRSNAQALPDLVASVAGDSEWFRELQQFLRHCSPLLRKVAGAHVIASLPPPRPAPTAPVPRRRVRPSTVRQPSGGRQRPPMKLDLRPLRLEPRRIPQRLPEHHLRPVRALGAPASLQRALGRFAAITMMQAANGLNVVDATAALDFPPGWGHTARHAVRGWAERHDRHTDLEAALNELIDRLTTDPPEIDYRARRQALADWLIPHETWKAVTGPLQVRQMKNNRLLKTDWGPDKHRATSLVLWVVMTRGDYLTAPLLRAATAPTDRSFVRAAQRLLFYLDKPPQTGRGGHVFDLLDAFADLRTEVEHAIDADALARPPDDARHQAWSHEATPTPVTGSPARARPR